MYDWLNNLIGPEATNVVGYVLLLFAVLFVAWFFIALIRRLGKGMFVVGGKKRAARLSVRDAAPVDNRRRLVLVRRDNVEHLILIGGPSDVVIERNIKMEPVADDSVPVLSWTEVDTGEIKSVEESNAIQNAISKIALPQANSDSIKSKSSDAPEKMVAKTTSFENLPETFPEDFNEKPDNEEPDFFTIEEHATSEIEEHEASDMPAAPAPVTKAPSVETMQDSIQPVEQMNATEADSAPLISPLTQQPATPRVEPAPFVKPAQAQPIPQVAPQGVNTETMAPAVNHTPIPAPQQNINPYTAAPRPQAQQPAPVPQSSYFAGGNNRPQTTSTPVAPIVQPSTPVNQPTALNPFPQFTTTTVPPRPAGQPTPNTNQQPFGSTPVVSKPAPKPVTMAPLQVPANSMKPFSNTPQGYPVQRVSNSVPTAENKPAPQVANGDLSGVSASGAASRSIPTASNKRQEPVIPIPTPPSKMAGDEFDKMLRDELMEPASNLKIVSSNNK